MELLQPNRKVEIRGSRITLKPISENEINNRYLAWLNDPEINKYLEVRYKKQSITDIYHYINSLRSINGGELFAIFENITKSHIGNCSITHFNPNNNGYAIYGLMIGEKSKNLGFAVDAEIMIVEYLFSFEEIRRLQGGVYSNNKAAWSILELIGFKKEGWLRKSAVLADGTITDGFIYGLLRDEWDKSKNKKVIKYFLKNMKILDMS